MQRTAINPWSWQDARGFTQAWLVCGAESVLVISGQGPLDAEGRLVGDGDFDAQARQTFDNLSAVLHQAGCTPADVVKVSLYLTDMTMLARYAAIKADYIVGAQPASTAIGVSALAMPGMLLEVEAVVAR